MENPTTMKQVKLNPRTNEEEEMQHNGDIKGETLYLKTQRDGSASSHDTA